MKFVTLALITLGLFACKESPSDFSNGSEAISVGDDGDPGDQDGDNDNRVVRERSDEVKTFMDYCLEEPTDPDLARTIEILKEIINEKFCGIVTGRLGRLDEIKLNFRGITDIRPFRGLTGLKTLNLGDNKIVDIKPLATLSGLRQLGLQSNPIEDFSPLSGLTRLQRLIVTGSNLKTVAAISQIRSLTALDLGRTDVVVLTGLGNLTNLQELSLAFTDVEDITELSSMVNLETLDLSNSRVQSLAPLANLANITTIELVGTVFMNQDFVKNNDNCPTAAASPVVADFCAPATP